MYVGGVEDFPVGRRAVVIYQQVEVGALVRLLLRGVAELVAEEQVQSLKAASALIALVRQEGLSGSLFDPAELRVLAHVLLVSPGKAKPSPTLRTGEAPMPLAMDSLMKPEVFPALKRLPTAGTGVGLRGGVREHVRPEAAHVSELSAAVRTHILPGV